MSNHKDIESFLRENRPQVDENPLFILEVQQKMEVVKGIKAEVDRQRNYGRTAIVIALALGVAAGGFLCEGSTISSQAMLRSDALSSCATGRNKKLIKNKSPCGEPSEFAARGKMEKTVPLFM